MLALVFLISSAAVSGGRLLRAAGLGRGVLAGLGLLALLLAGPARADSGSTDAAGALPPADEVAPPDAAGLQGAGSAHDTNPAERETEVADPRSIYNQGVEALGSRELEDAERLLSRARRNAGGDECKCYQ